MKKRILSILVVMLLLFTGVNVLAGDTLENKMKTCFESDDIFFSQVSILSDEKYATIEISEANSFLRTPDAPMLPYFTKTYVYPFGTKILNVEIIPKTVIHQKIDKKIKPAPRPIPKTKISLKNAFSPSENKQIYLSNALYPNEWYSYNIKCGLMDGKRSVILTVNLFPVRYSPGTNLLYQTTDFDVNIEFIKPQKMKTSSENYDLLIIAPKIFSRALQPLVKHKNSYNIRTILKTTNSIYSDYSGRDNAEKIKYFIKDAIEEWNITYVLLVGGRVGQLFKWYVPSRYTALDDWSDWEVSHLSDLYYADVYKYNTTSHQYEFDDWDSNGNGIFAEWSRDTYLNPEDEIDFVPDVYVGRLACRNLAEVRIIVKKIVNYESNTFGADWFKNMILVGGDTVPTTNENSSQYPYYEGEIETNLGGSYLEPLGFNLLRLWASNGNLTRQADLIKALNKGAGFLYLSGHGNPNVWSTHPPNNDLWIDALYNPGMALLRNRNKLPVCVVGGCHSSQFDVTNLNFIKGLMEEGLKYFSEDITLETGGFWKNEWAYRCWSWNLVRQRNGGAIACIGNTGLGYGSGGLSCISDLDGWITSHFFQVYADQSTAGNYTLGRIHSQTITDYINTFSASWDRLDAKTVEGWVLIGDPSLRIGGYPLIH